MISFCYTWCCLGNESRWQLFFTTDIEVSNQTKKRKKSVCVTKGKEGRKEGRREREEEETEARVVLRNRMRTRETMMLVSVEYVFREEEGAILRLGELGNFFNFVFRLKIARVVWGKGFVDGVCLILKDKQIWVARNVFTKVGDLGGRCIVQLRNYDGRGF